MRTKLVQEIDWLSSGAEHHTGRSSGGKEISGSRRQIGQHKTDRTLGNSGIQTEAVIRKKKSGDTRHSGQYFRNLRFRNLRNRVKIFFNETATPRSAGRDS